jgi:hypothetical protein
MKDMNWPSSGFLGVLAANNIVFGFALHEICQTYHQRPARVPRGHDMSKISHTEPS